VTPRIVFRPQAASENLDARAWYEERRRGLGEEFAIAVDQTSREHSRASVGISARPWRDGSSNHAAFSVCNLLSCVTRRDRSAGCNAWPPRCSPLASATLRPDVRIKRTPRYIWLIDVDRSNTKTIHVKVQANARTKSLEPLSDGRLWQAKLKSPAVNGKANGGAGRSGRRALRLPQGPRSLSRAGIRAHKAGSDRRCLNLVPPR
jgi:hypothetical protein